MITPLRRCVQMVIDMQKFQHLVLIKYGCVIPRAIATFVSDGVPISIDKRIKYIMHMTIVLLKSQHTWHVGSYQLGKLWSTSRIPTVDTRFPPCSRNRIMRIVPDIVIQNAHFDVLSLREQIFSFYSSLTGIACRYLSLGCHLVTQTIDCCLQSP